MTEQEETRFLAARLAQCLEVPIEALQEARWELKRHDLTDEGFQESYVKILAATVFLKDLMEPGLEQISPSTSEKPPSEAGEEALINAVEYGKGLLQGLAKVLDGTGNQKSDR